MQDVINHSDFQNSFEVLMTSSTKSESESSPSPACLESSPSPSPNVWDSSPSPRTRVPISAYSYATDRLKR